MIQNKIEKPVYSCVLIGSTNLLIKCFEILKNHKWDITGIFTNDTNVSRYFTNEGVPIESDSNSIVPFLNKRKVDYLFSIVNEIILSKEILSIPEKSTINYHDSYLPEGAGVNSTTWAIINKRETHGVTWHMVDEGIDTGEILEQKQFNVTDADTSFILNARCFSEAIESFKILLDNIKNNTLQPKKQDLKIRTYHPLNERPNNLGFIDFREKESEWEPLLRALYFGINDNNFCTPKIFFKGRIYVIKGYNWQNEHLQLEPGQIKIINNEILHVQCTKRVLCISKLKNLLGEDVSIQNLINSNDLTTGYKVEFPKPDYLTSLFNYNKKALISEKYWINRFSDLNVIDFPFYNVINNEKYSVNKPIYSYNINEEAFNLCNNNNNNGFLSNITALLLMYISKLHDRTTYDIWFQSNFVEKDLTTYFSAKVPLSVKFDKVRSCIKNMDDCSDIISSVSKKGSFSLDMFQRIRYLKETNQKALFNKIPFLIEWADDSVFEKSDDAIEWKLIVSEKNKEIYLFSTKNRINQLLGDKFFLHFDIFMHNMLKSVNQPLGKIKLISEEENKKKIFEYNEKKVAYPEFKCVNELIEEWITKTPNEVALICEGRKLTYSDLGKKANIISHCLQSKNVKMGEVIGVKMNRSENVIISYLAIWNVGCAYVPLDPELPTSRLKYMVENSNVNLIITDDVSTSQLNVESLNFNDALSTVVAEIPLFSNVKNTDLAYIKYTSGSTGLPKGVMISHENIVVFLYSYREVIGVKSKRTGTCVAPLSFDTSVDEIYSCICFGGTAHIMMKHQVLDLDFFAKYLVENKINVSYIIPEFLEGVGKNLKNKSEVFLRTVLTGLHAKRNRAFKNYFDLSSEILVLNAYGPTEVTYGSSAYQVCGTEPLNEFTPIGKPFPNYQTFIVDSDMQLKPDYVAGELMIAGPALSSGYINNPESTREKFVDLSFGDYKTRAYKTGDVVCYLPSGDISFIGRNDDQVKISGYRIEIGEIEEALNKIDIIDQSLVLKKNIGSLGNRLVAYIVFKNRSNKDIHFVESELKNLLPNYMVPSFIIPLDNIPRFPNDKVNVNALPDPNFDTQKSKNWIDPDNETEKKLKQIFKQHLGVGEISVVDNFFEIGGDSLAAVHIMQEIEIQFQRHIPISLLYQFPTIRKIASEIMYKTIEGKRDSIIEIKEKGDLSPIFFIHSLGGSVLMYNEIIQHLNKRHPVFGVQSGYDSSLDLSRNTIVSIASGYVDEIIRIAASRKVNIAGFSFGGVLAFEIACQLKKIEYPHKLIILDTRMNNFRRKFHPHKYNREELYIFSFWMIKFIIRMILDIVVRRNQKAAKNKYEHLLFEIAVFKRERKNTKQVNEPGGMDVEIAKVSHLLSEKYEPGLYKSGLTLIQCVGGKNGKVFNKMATNYFRSFVKGKIRKYYVNAYHIDMLKQEKGKKVAEIINKAIHENTTSIRP